MAFDEEGRRVHSLGFMSGKKKKAGC